MALKLPTPQSIMSSLTGLAKQTFDYSPIGQNIAGYKAVQEANQNLAKQQEYARKQQEQIKTLQSAGQYPIAYQGPNNEPVYLNPNTGRYQNVPAGAVVPPSTPPPATTQPRGGTGGNNNFQITQGDINLGASVPGVKDFTFNWTNESNAAYDALKDFYAKLLDFAEGDINLAKRVIQYTYEQGNREATQTFQEKTQQAALENPVETAKLLTSLNKRGVVESGFGKESASNLKAEQDLRTLQVQRALENQQSRLGFAKETGLQEQEQNLAKTKFDLERQRRKESEQMAINKRAIKADEYNTEMDKAAQAEQRRVQGLSNQILTGLTTGGTETGKITTGSTVTRHGATGQIADSSGRLYGGWYNNPTTGKNQRYWGSGQWTDS